MRYGIPVNLTQLVSVGRGSSDLTPHLTQPLVLEDGRTPRILSQTLCTISAFIIAAVLWATLSDVREVTIAHGQIIPSGFVHTVHHLEGGIVAELLVGEGSQVVAGQPLIRLNQIAAASDLQQLEVRRDGLILQMIRLDAESQASEPEFGAVATARPELAVEQAKLYASAMEQRRQEHATLAARVVQRRHEAETSAAALEAAKAQVPVLRDLFDIQRQLVTQGLTARKAYLETLSALLRAEGEYASAQTKLQAALAARSEAESALTQADATAAQKIAEERSKAATDRAEVERQITKLADRLERVIVRAPSSGVVQEIVPKSAGEVVKPGDVIARIVPTGVDLVAEVRIDPKDSGHVKVGARADVKFATYDPAIFGTLIGTIDYVSPTTFVPQPSQPLSAGQAVSEPYYKALVRLPSDHVGTGALSRPISPGMVVQANIVTGSKSIARYMFKPISNSLEAAFTER